MTTETPASAVSTERAIDHGAEETANNNNNNISITDPTGRYERGNELLGRGASKEVFRAFDREEGMEVAWNQLKVDHLSEQSAAKILGEIQILTQLDNENIIKFYHSWLHRNSAGNYEVYFITELMTSGTLKSYLQKTKGPLKLKVVKNWCRQILKALLYLHTKQPPIIHRDLKCDNVFINGNNGQAKLGDFGLAVLKDREMLTSVLGTPEFMAPELYEESYNEKVDVYAFGMCLLEMVTKDYPYSECENAAQIYRKVTQGIKPLALSKIEDKETRSFIEMCISQIPKERPSVTELLDCEFMMVEPDAPGKAVMSDASQEASTNNASLQASSATSPLLSNKDAEILIIESFHVEVVSIELPTVHLKMKVVMSNPMYNKEVKFPFDFEKDTVSAVIEEMIRENVLSGAEEGERASCLIRNALKEPLAQYEILLANVPFRAEISNSKDESSVPSNAAEVSESTEQTVSTTSTSENLVEYSEAAIEAMIQDHPEVAALLLKQKKEIELLALFHRREYQCLIKGLRKQIMGRYNRASIVENNTANNQVNSGLNIGGGLTSPSSLDIDGESHFVNKVRQYMFETTGNSIWLATEGNQQHCPPTAQPNVQL